MPAVLPLRCPSLGRPRCELPGLDRPDLSPPRQSRRRGARGLERGAGALRWRLPALPQGGAQVRSDPGLPAAGAGAGSHDDRGPGARRGRFGAPGRSEEHTSELQSLTNLVCRLLLEKKKKKYRQSKKYINKNKKKKYTQ